MYNVNVKKMYIERRKNEVIMSTNFLERVFNNAEEAEIELKKDIAEFNENEIKQYYISLQKTSLDVLVVLNSQLSIYADWYCENINTEKQNAFDNVKGNELYECLNLEEAHKKIVLRKDVMALCEDLPNPKDKVIILGIFEGIKGSNFKELSLLKISDIQVDGKTYTANLCTNRSVSISSLLYTYILEAVREDTYFGITGKGVRANPLLDLGYIIKVYPNMDVTIGDYIKLGKSIYRSLARALSYCGAVEYLNASSLYESGKIQMLLDLAKNSNVDPMEYLQSGDLLPIEQQYDCKVVRTVFIRKYKAIIENL